MPTDESKPIDYCTDFFVEDDDYNAENAQAQLRNPRNPSSEELAMWKTWQAGQELRIRFLDGSNELHARVEAVAREWLNHANLIFTFGNFPKSEIRVTFTGSNYSSLVGTDAQSKGQNQHTLRLGGFTMDTADELFRRVVLHEFGHAIGCIHEQSSPASHIPWDEEKVIKHYADEPNFWSEAKTRKNVLKRYARDEGIEFTEHDPCSIMQYPVPKELTVGGFEIGWNNELSDLDKSFVAQMYPPEG